MVVFTVDASMPFFAGAEYAVVGASAAIIKEVASTTLDESSASLAPVPVFLSCHF